MNHRDRGVGAISTAAGVLVFLVFLLGAVQLLFALYASSTVTAVANDAVQRAATSGSSWAVIEEDARAALGAVGDAADFTWAVHDADGDGRDDTVVLRVVALPPRFMPRSIGEGLGFGVVDRTVRARVEELQP